MQPNLTPIRGIPIYDSNRPGEIISPTIINSYSALTVPAYWRAINFLADNLASFPRCVHVNGTEPATPHPLTRILHRRPNQYQNSIQFWRTLFAHTANHGNGYARIQRKGFTNTVDSLHNLLPDDVWPFRYDAADGAGIRQYYFLRNTKTVLTYDDVIHLSALSYDGQLGHNVVWLHREGLQRGITIDKYLTRYLQKGTVLRGAIEIPVGVSDEQRESLIVTLRTYFQGADAERDVMVLSDGAKLNNATLSPQDSQLLQQGAYTTKQIAQITGVPPQFLYEFSEQKYNGTSIESIGQDVVRYTFRPWIEQIEAELTIKLLSESEQDAGMEINLDPSALLRGDTKALTDTTVQKVGAGIQTRNEARGDLGLPPSKDPDADKLKTLGDTAPKPAAPIAVPPAQNAKGTPHAIFAAGPHKYASTHVTLPGEIAGPMLELANSIPEGELAADGRETEPHVTLKYGLHDDDPASLVTLLSAEAPISLQLGECTLFAAAEDREYDVLKVDVESTDMERLFDKIKASVPNTEKWPEYHPHATIAYLKPGMGKKYTGAAKVTGQTVTVSTITFSDRQGKRTEIKLQGTPRSQNARHIKLVQFASLIADAAARVHIKTTKATDAATKKHAGNAQGLTAWANAFTAEQGEYATAALTPVLTTYASLTGQTVDGAADRIGKRYARELGQHLLKLGKGEQSTPPDLTAITNEIGATHA